MPCIIPSKIEQQKICDFLDENCSALDSAIISCKKQIDNLIERKQIIINELVTGKVKVS